MAKIIFGPTGIGSAKEAISNLREFSKMGFGAAEVLFTYGIYLKKEDAIEIGQVARELGILLSVHAPYYVNLNSLEKSKLEASKKRIIDCCEIGHLLGARKIVIHPGFYSEMKSDDARKIIAGNILEILDIVKEKKFDVEICVEVMGKKNVFGSIDEVSWLVKETGCNFCIDFAHVLARYGSNMFDEVEKSFPQKNWQCHFSGIEYGEKGEKKHKLTTEDEWRNLLLFLDKLNKEIVIINESPEPVRDSLMGIKIWRKLER